MNVFYILKGSLRKYLAYSAYSLWLYVLTAFLWVHSDTGEKVQQCLSWVPANNDWLDKTCEAISRVSKTKQNKLTTKYLQQIWTNMSRQRVYLWCLVEKSWQIALFLYLIIIHACVAAQQKYLSRIFTMYQGDEYISWMYCKSSS